MPGLNPLKKEVPWRTLLYFYVIILTNDAQKCTKAVEKYFKINNLEVCKSDFSTTGQLFDFVHDS